MHAHRDTSILDTIPGLVWEAVEVDQSLDPEGHPIDVYIVHEHGPLSKMREIVKWLREREKDVGRSLLQNSIYLVRPVGIGRTDVDLRKSHNK